VGGRPRDLSDVGELRSDRAEFRDARDGDSFGSCGRNGTGHAHADGGEGAWNAPDLSLLGTGRRPAPAFPLALLGPLWGPWAERRAAAASAPVDYVAIALLACAAGALANVRWPIAGADWSEPPVLWAGLVGSPSAGKSPALDQALALLLALESRLAIGFDDERRRYETGKQLAEATLEDWKARVKEAVKAGDAPPPKPAEAEVPVAPERPRVRVSDFTTERLATLAAGLPRGLLVVRDELSGWLGGFDRYGGKGSDRSFALEMYGGRSYVVDRASRPDPIRIHHLTVGVLCGVQPDKLDLILDGPDDGLAARLLWCWPDQIPDFALAREGCDEGEARAAFSRFGDLAMGSDEAGEPEPVRVRLTRTAVGELEAFGRQMQHRTEEASGPMAGALGKARGDCLRLAAVLEFLWWAGDRDEGEPTAISDASVIRAAALVGGYFLPMAERAFGDAAIPPAERAAMALARYLRRERLTTFNARLLRRAMGGPLREADAMKRACTDLVEAGLIRPAGPRSGPQGGRPSSDYEVNPAVHGRAP
jgi:hypothetical protein